MNLLKCFILLLLFSFQLNHILAQPSNDECSNPTVLTPYQTCSGTIGDLTGSSKSNLTPSNSF